MTFGDIVNDLSSLIDFTSPKTSGRVRAYTVLALRDLSPNVMHWSRKDTTFPTVIGQRSYSYGVGSLPINIHKILNVWKTSSGLPDGDPLMRLTLHSSRSSSLSGSPNGYATSGRKIHFNSKPSAVETLWVDYIVSGSYGNDGQLITSTSDASTNDWIEYGSEEIKAYVQWKYCLSVAKDFDAAQAHELCLNDLLRSGADSEADSIDYVVPEIWGFDR